MHSHLCLVLDLWRVASRYQCSLNQRNEQFRSVLPVYIMPDIVLPAGASIAVFVMTIISWYGMLRTGIQLVHNDLQAMDSVERDVRSLVEDLKKQQRALAEWKKQWLVWESTPESLYLDFWGEAEHRNIKTKLENMYTNCVAAEKILNSFTKLSERQWGTMSKARKIFLKTKFVWTKREYVQKLIDILVKDMNLLVTAAKDGWQRDGLINQGTVDRKAVYHAGIGHLLVPIAMRTRDDANALHHCCSAVQNIISIELDLDIFNYTGSVSIVGSDVSSSFGTISREMHSANIARAANDGRFTWSVLSQDAHLDDCNLVRMHVKRSELSGNSFLNAPVAFKQVMEGRATKSHFTSAGTCFSIIRADRPHEWNSNPRRTLRKLLSGNAPPLYVNANLLGTISKFRVSFELAQACLLFLRTSWFPGICSCSIRCGSLSAASTQFKYEFGLKMGIINHEAPQWGATALHDCWCIAEHNWNDLTSPLRRLGLLLVEIVLGTPILGATSDRGGVIQSITFVEGSPPTLLRQPKNFDQVLRLVYIAFSRSKRSTDAIRYCLSKNFPNAPTDNDTKDLLAEYYVDVVAPYDLMTRQCT